ncbi:MAG: hypothetical protein RR449_07755 [Christensenella sp.]
MDKKKRLTKYETHIEPRIDEIAALMRAGGTEEKAAKMVGVAYSTFRKYKNGHPEFRAALIESEEPANMAVEASLFDRTRGGEHEQQKAIKIRTVTYKDGKRVREEERVEMVTETTYVPADVRAIMFWLCNRDPERWKQKIDTALMDNDGKNIKIILGLEKEDVEK